MTRPLEDWEQHALGLPRTDQDYAVEVLAFCCLAGDVPIKGRTLKPARCGRCDADGFRRYRVPLSKIIDLAARRCREGL